MENCELEPEWMEMVGEFSDICREFGHLTELEVEVTKKEETFERALECARALDQTKEKKLDTLFEKSNNIYQAQNCYESLPNIKTSITHLVEVIKDEMKQKGSKFIWYPVNVLDNKMKYLQIYFGLKYEDACSPKQLYQVCKLLLILLKCTEKYSREVLNSMKEASYLRFRDEFDNSYKEPMLFIKKELLKGLSFIDALAIEYFVGTYRYFINTYFQTLIERVVQEIPYVTSKYRTEILDDLSTMALMKLKELNKTERPIFGQPDDLFWRAYLHFVLLSVEDTVEERYLDTANFFYNKKPVPLLFWIDPDLIKNNITVWIAKNPGLRTGKNVVTVKFDNKVYSVEDLVSGNADIIAKHLGGKANARLIRQHSEDYCKLAQLYISRNMRTLSEPINLIELMNIVDLFEENKNRLIKAPDGYKVKSTSRSEKTFKSILRYLKDEVSRDSILTDKEPGWYAIEGFLNTLNSRLANASQETVKKHNEIRKEIYEYLKSVVPILPEEPHKYKNITEIAESILNSDTLRDYCELKARDIIVKLERGVTIMESVKRTLGETP